jgi:YD repeat-containing protein
MFHSAVAGDASFKFQNIDYGYYPSNSGKSLGTFLPIEDNSVGASLVFTGAEATGNLTLTDKSGAVYVYLPNLFPTGMALDHVTYPDGTRVDISYDAFRPKRVESSRGYAIIFEYMNGPNGAPTMSAACAVNLAVEAVSPTANCPAGANKVLYNYGMIPIVHKRQGKSTVNFSRSALTSVVDRANAQTTYSYDDGGHVSCITDPGQSACRVQINYNECLQDPEYEPGAPDAVLGEMHLIEKVLSQVYADGSRYDYSYNNGLYDPAMKCPDEFDDGFPKSGTYSFADTNGQVTTVDLIAGRPTRITAPLGRVTDQQRGRITPIGTTYIGAAGVVTGQDLPDGNRSEYTYDNRANVVQVRSVPKIGSGDPVLTQSAAYPSTCTDRKTCNQPTSVTDAGGDTTSYTYDPAHGGVLTTTAPAVGGVSPITRYYYVQREAWLRSGAGYAKTGEPIWLKSEERSCRTSVLDPVAGTCSAGAGDLVRTLYDYGPEAGPNNLWLRGMAVEADGQTLRTCYQYDQLGRRIAETKPLGTGATCP